MTSLELKIFEIVRKIPEGKVATYGQIAILAGNKNLSRVVGNTMHKNPLPFFNLASRAGFLVDYNISDSSSFLQEKDFTPVPCHRVVNSKGEMGKNFGLGGPSIQAEMLKLEGIEINSEKLTVNNLKKYEI